MHSTGMIIRIQCRLFTIRLLPQQFLTIIYAVLKEVNVSIELNDPESAGLTKWNKNDNGQTRDCKNSKQGRIF